MSPSSLLSSSTVGRREHAPPAATADTPPLTGVLERLTVEHLAYGLLVVTALLARSIGLGSRPLAPAEAEVLWPPGGLRKGWG